MYFNPRPPRGGATARTARSAAYPDYFNPRPPRGGRHAGWLVFIGIVWISIHAPREGGDWRFPTPCRKSYAFQSTPPARGATPGGSSTRRGTCAFQSTPPARGATEELDSLTLPDIFQSTPPGRGATAVGIRCVGTRPISIHAPREGGDGTAKESIAANEISIHAPREGGDCQRALASHR